MKQILVVFGLAVCTTACGDNNVGNRTYDMNTPVDSANYQVGNTHDDTTATTNNNIYNPDSMPTNTTIEDIGARQNETEQSEGQQRINAGPNVPQNTQNAPGKKQPGGQGQ